jgi:acyl transferase domain-containing protein
MPKQTVTPIAIVGMGSVFPGRGDVTGFWRDLFEGRDLISDVPPSHWLVDDYYDEDPKTKDRTYGRRGGFINPIAFDPLYFGIPPKAMEGTDTAQLLALIAAQMTLEDIAQDSGGKIDKSRTSIILGVASATEMTAHMAGRLQRPTWINAMRQDCQRARYRTSRAGLKTTMWIGKRQLSQAFWAMSLPGELQTGLI